MKTGNITKKEALKSALSAVHKDKIDAEKRLSELGDSEKDELKKEHLEEFTEKMDSVYDVLVEIAEEDLDVELEKK